MDDSMDVTLESQDHVVAEVEETLVGVGVTPVEVEVAPPVEVEETPVEAEDTPIDVKDTPRSHEWDKFDVKEYLQQIVYIMNHDRKNSSANTATREALLHQERCQIVLDCFLERTDAKVISVWFPPGSPNDALNTFFEHETSKWDNETLVHIYFNGKAAGAKNSYKWKFDNLPHPVNVSTFMARLDRTHADIFYFLDCWIGTRWRRVPGRKHAMTEMIVARDECPHEDTFEIEAVQNGNFAKRLSQFMANCTARPRKPPKNQVKQCIRSIPQLMRLDYGLDNNTTRLWNLKPDKTQQDLKIWRIMVDPVISRQRGKLCFVKRTIQSPPKKVEECHPDEGVADMDVDMDLDGEMGGEASPEGNGLFVVG